MRVPSVSYFNVIHDSISQPNIGDIREAWKQLEKGIIFIL